MSFVYYSFFDYYYYILILISSAFRPSFFGRWWTTRIDNKISLLPKHKLASRFSFSIREDYLNATGTLP